MSMMSWSVPVFPRLVLALIPGILCYAIATSIDSNSSGKGFSALLVLGSMYILGVGFLPILFFPLMLLLVPLFLLVRLGSKEKGAKIAALVGLLCFVLSFVFSSLEMRNAGPYWKLEQATFGGDALGQLGPRVSSDYSEEELLEAISGGSRKLRKNAGTVLLYKAQRNKDDDLLRSLLDQLREISRSEPEEQALKEIVRDFESLLDKRQPKPEIEEPRETPRLEETPAKSDRAGH
jgi:hypothetical protein